MSKKQEKCTQKGITLVALVITIIVMLILVVVTVQIAVNGGLFDYAKRATGDTRNAIEEENGLATGQIKVGDTTYNSMDSFLNGPKLKYYVRGEKLYEGRKITVYLEDSTLDWQRSGKKQDDIQKYLEYILEKEIGMKLEDVRKMEEEEIIRVIMELNQKISVTLVTPDGTNEKLTYFIDKDFPGELSYTYTTYETGNYTFKVIDFAGRTSEITVPISMQVETKTFSIIFPDLTIKEYKFYEGDSFEDIGKYENDIYDELQEELKKYNTIMIKEENGEKKEVKNSEKIIENGVYVLTNILL